MHRLAPLGSHRHTVQLAVRLALAALLCLVALLAPLSARPASAITATEDLSQGLAAADLVSSLLNADSGISGVANIQYTGAAIAAGTFSGGAASIGFESGLVLSSGKISSAIGSAGTNASTQHNGPGDADLDALVNVETLDAAVLQFDFVPEGDHIQIIYVFGSEEYPEYVGQFNDGFALFVNGENKAVVEKVDGSEIPVTINSINDHTNEEYYRANGGGINTAMDGLTTVLSLKAPVNPGVTNHIKIAIADAVDTAYDSIVFLKMQSLTSREADLSLEMAVDNYTPAIDSNVTFLLTLHNAGPYNATPQVGNILPAGLSFVSATPGQGSYDPATGIWTVGTVGADSSAALQIVATANTSEKVENIAQVIESDRFDPDSTPNNNIPGEDDQKSIRLGPNTPPTAIILSLEPIREDSAPGFTAGIFSASDPDDGDVHVYTLTDDAGGRFVLDNNRLLLASGAALDYETAASYEITAAATDAGGLSISQAFTIPIENVNESPILSLPDDQVTSEDTALVFSTAGGNSLSLSDPDAGSQPLQVTLTAGHGTLTLSGITGLSFSTGDGAADSGMTFTGSQADINSALNGLRFQPVQDYNGPAGLQIVANDQGYTGLDGPLAASGSIEISVTPLNDPPLVTDYDLAGSEDTPLDFSLAGFSAHFSDVDTPYQGDSLFKIKILTLPGHGELQLSGAPVSANQEISAAGLDELVFLPEADWHGDTSFEWNASDGTAYAASPAIANLSITPVNDAPTGVSLSNATLNENQASPYLVGLFSTTDVDSSDSHTYTLVSGDGDSDNAAFAIQENRLVSAQSFDYETRQAYSIRVQTRDSGNLTHAQAFTIHIQNLNEAPELSLPPAQATAEDTPLFFSTVQGNSIHISDVDAGEEPLLISLAATNGSLTLAGVAGLTFSIGDGSGDASLAFSASLSGLNAALDGLSFLPDPDYNGPAGLQITVDDLGHTGSGEALSDGDTLVITVDPANDPPVNTTAPSIGGAVHTGQTLAAGDGEWNDASDLAPGDLAFTYQWQRAEDAGGLNAADITGATASTYTVTQTDNAKYLRVQVTATDDGEGEPASQSVTTASDWVLVDNSHPVIAEGASTTITMDEDNDPLPFDLTLHASDPDLIDTLTWSLIVPPDHGSAAADGVGNSQVVTYTPETDYHGDDSFTLQVSDGLGGADTIAVEVTIRPRNDLPVNTAAPTILGAPKTGQILAAEDGEWNDGVDLQPGNLTFTYQWQRAEDADGLNAADIAGASNATYFVTAADRDQYLRVQVTATDDGEGEPATQSAAVASVWTLVENSSPLIAEGASTTVVMDEDGDPLPFDLTLYASDPDLIDTLTWSLTASPAHGSALADGVGAGLDVAYTPDPDHHGSDSFTIQVSDGLGGTDTIAVEVTIRPRNDPPANTTPPAIQGSGHPGELLEALQGEWDDGLDLQPGELTFSYQWQRAGDAGGLDSVDIPGATAATYTPVAADVGKFVSVKVTASDDGEGLPANQSTTAASTFVEVWNTAPIIAESDPLEVTMDEDGDPLAFSLTLNASDEDDDSLTWSIASPPAHGMASAGGSGVSQAIGYSPEADYNGQDSFVVQVSDGLGGVDTITVNVTVWPRNDPPVNLTAPGLTGLAQLGQVLTAVDGVWEDPIDHQPGNLTFTYQWLRAGGAAGQDAQPIPGATAAAYSLTEVDMGQFVAVQVTATDDGEGEPANQSTTAVSPYVQMSLPERPLFQYFLPYIPVQYKR